jgi:hypothetical protein
MKRPVSVVVTLVVVGMLVLVSMFFVVKIGVFGGGFKAIALSAITPILLSVTWVGIFFRKYWAKILASILILFQMLILFGVILFKIHDFQNGLIFIFGAIFCLLAWWVYSFMFGRSSKEYFKSQSIKND